MRVSVSVRMGEGVVVVVVVVKRMRAYKELGVGRSLRIDERVFILEDDPRLCAIRA